MRKFSGFLLLILVMITIHVPAWAQQPDVSGLITRRYVTCQDIAYNMKYLIPQYTASGDMDTVWALIDYWDQQCQPAEVTTRLTILLLIDQYLSPELPLDPQLLDQLDMYRYTRNNQQTKRFYVHYYDNIYADSIDAFTMELARRNQDRIDLTVEEQWLLLFYHNEFEAADLLLNSPAMDGSPVKGLYAMKQDEQDKEVLFSAAFMSGVWIPTDSLKIVGTHPILGFRVGMIYKRLLVDATFAFRFLRSPNNYQVVLNDSLFTTDHYFGGYVGLDLGYQLYWKNHHRIDLLGGIAYDGFDAVTVKNEFTNLNENKSLNSLNLNAGLGYKYVFNRGGFLGLEFKYNWVNYKNPGGTDLSGNTMTVNLVYGFVGRRGFR